MLNQNLKFQFLESNPLLRNLTLIGFIINTVSKFKTMEGETEKYVLSGSALMNGALKLNSQWMATGFNESVRLLGDFGSRIYYIKKTEK